MDLKKRVQELAELEGVEVVRPGRCWVDADETCPYGDPEGQYVMRPETFCNETCHIFENFVGHALHNHGGGGCEECEQAEVKAICDHFDEHHVTVVSELRARAEHLPDESEQIVLEIAAEILDEHKMDRDILIQEDLPEEEDAS
jgi:hypothetical protein